MYSEKYRLRYLPLFYEDLDEKISYIAEELKNPKAASDLLCGDVLWKVSRVRGIPEISGRLARMCWKGAWRLRNG